MLFNRCRLLFVIVVCVCCLFVVCCALCIACCLSWGVAHCSLFVAVFMTVCYC